jgi:hypothetical protein
MRGNGRTSSGTLGFTSISGITCGGCSTGGLPCGGPPVRGGFVTGGLLVSVGSIHGGNYQVTAAS